MVSDGVSHMGKTGVIFIELRAKVNRSYYCEHLLCCWWRIVAWYQSQVSSVQMDSPAGWCTTAPCEKHAWVVQQQGGHIEHITVWISSSKCWNYSNSVNIWCFAVYTYCIDIVDKGVTFWHTSAWQCLKCGSQWVDGHGWRPGTYFQGWTPSSNFMGQCIHCGRLILRKISKISATRCQILRLKCTKFDFRWGPPQTPLGKLTALPQTP